jgi:hypothetical protein
MTAGRRGPGISRSERRASVAQRLGIVGLVGEDQITDNTILGVLSGVGAARTARNRPQARSRARRGLQRLLVRPREGRHDPRTVARRARRRNGGSCCADAASESPDADSLGTSAEGWRRSERTGSPSTPATASTRPATSRSTATAHEPNDRQDQIPRARSRKANRSALQRLRLSRALTNE